MPGMPQHMHKTMILARLDAFVNAPDRTEVQAYREALAAKNGVTWKTPHAYDISEYYGLLVKDRPIDPAELAAIPPGIVPKLTQEGVLFGQDNALHIDEIMHMIMDWYRPHPPSSPAGEDGWWPAQPAPVEDTLRQGTIEAIDLVLATDKRKLDSYWICAGGPEILIQCFAAFNDQQVTFIILTPEHPLGAMSMVSMGQGAANQAGQARTRPAGARNNRSGTGIVVVGRAAGTAMTQTETYDRSNGRPSLPVKSLAAAYSPPLA